MPRRNTSPTISELYNLRHNIQRNPEPQPSQPTDVDVMFLGTFIPAREDEESSPSASANALKRNLNKQPAPRVLRTAQSAQNASPASSNDQNLKPEATQNALESIRDGAEGDDDIQELPSLSQRRRSNGGGVVPPPPPIGLLGANNHQNNERDGEPLFERRSDLAQRLSGDGERSQHQESSSGSPQPSFFDEVVTVDFGHIGASFNETRLGYNDSTGQQILQQTRSRCRSPVHSRNLSQTHCNNSSSTPMLGQDPPPLRSSNRDVDQWPSRSRSTERRNGSGNRNGSPTRNDGDRSRRRISTTDGGNGENAREWQKGNFFGQRRSRSRSRERRNVSGNRYGSPTGNDADRSRRRISTDDGADKRQRRYFYDQRRSRPRSRGRRNGSGSRSGSPNRSRRRRRTDSRADYSRERHRDDSDDDQRHQRRKKPNSEERRHHHSKKHKKSKHHSCCKHNSPTQEEQQPQITQTPAIVPTTSSDTNQGRGNQNPVNPNTPVTTQGVAEVNGQQQPQITPTPPIVPTTSTDTNQGSQGRGNQNPVNPRTPATIPSPAIVLTTSSDANQGSQGRGNQNPVNPNIPVTTQGVAEVNSQHQPEVIPSPPTAPTGNQNPVILNNSIPGHPAAGGGGINGGIPSPPNVPSSNIGANRGNPRQSVRTIPASEASKLIRTCRESHCWMKGRVFGTREEGIQHLAKVHGKELCFVCFKGIVKTGPEHRNHVFEEHEDDMSKSVCPIDRCGERFCYAGMYRHQIRKHYVNVEPIKPTTSRKAGGRAIRSHSNNEEDEEDEGDEHNTQTRQETSSAQAPPHNRQRRQRLPTPSTSTNQFQTTSTRQPIPRTSSEQRISPPAGPTTTSRISHENQSRMRTSASNAIPSAITTTTVTLDHNLRNQNQSQRNGTIDKVEENLATQGRRSGGLQSFKIPKTKKHS